MEGWLGQKKLMFKDRLDAVNLKREWLLKIESGWLCSNFQLRSMGVLYQSVSQPYRPVSTMLSLLSPLSLSVVGVKHSKPRKFFSQFDILNAWTWLHLPALLSAFYHQVHSSAFWELVFSQRTAFHRCKFEQPTEVSDCIIWFLWEWFWSSLQNQISI